MKQRIIPIVSIIIGILAGVLTFQYIQSERKKLHDLEEKLFARARKIPVVAAARDIPAQPTIGQIDLAWKEEYQQVVGERAVLQEDAPMILGRKALFSMNKGDPILWAYVEGGRSGTGLASIVSPGLRAMSLSVGGAQAVSSMIEPNDRVDVLGSFMLPSKTNPQALEAVTLTVLQDVSVLAVGQTLGKAGEGARAGSGYSTVTFEVTPREAELLAFAENMKGRLTLTLRNPGDPDYVSALPEVNFEMLERVLPELNKHRQEVIRHKGPQP